MSDITTVWRRDSGDWVLNGSQLQAGNDLASAVLISIFSDRRATPDDVVAYGLADARGWWADTATQQLGSRLWLLHRAKQWPETLRRASDYISEGLQWLVDDGVVGSFDITTEWVRAGVLGAQVVAIKPDGTRLAFRYDWVWN